MYRRGVTYYHANPTHPEVVQGKYETLSRITLLPILKFSFTGGKIMKAQLYWKFYSLEWIFDQNLYVLIAFLGEKWHTQILFWD
jgi:hypothetical protein